MKKRKSNYIYGSLSHLLLLRILWALEMAKYLWNEMYNKAKYILEKTLKKRRKLKFAFIDNFIIYPCINVILKINYIMIMMRYLDCLCFCGYNSTVRFDCKVRNQYLYLFYGFYKSYTYLTKFISVM